MTTRIGSRFAVSQIASIAMAETRTCGAGRARRPSSPRADRRMGHGSDRSWSNCWLRSRCSSASGRFRHCCDRRRVAALGDAGGAARLPSADPQDVLRHAGRQSLRPLLLHGAVRRPAVDLRPPHRRFRAYHAVPSCSRELVRGSAANRQPPSRLVTDSYLCGWLSRYGDRLHSRIVACWRVPVSFG